MQYLAQILITSRPLGWFIFVISYLAGVIISGNYFTTEQVLTCILIGPILSFVIYTYNDIYDYNSDKINARKKIAIMGNALEPKYWTVFKSISNTLIVLILLLPLIFGNWIGLLCILTGLIIGIGYSIPPLRFKTRLGGDILASCLGFLSLYCLGATSTLSQLNYLTILKYVLFSTLMVSV